MSTREMTLVLLLFAAGLLVGVVTIKADVQACILIACQ